MHHNARVTLEALVESHVVQTVNWAYSLISLMTEVASTSQGLPLSSL